MTHPVAVRPGAVRDWLRARDRHLAATRRATRTAVVMPAVFAVADLVIGDPAVAIFAAFGSFAMLLFADFGGPVRDRLAAQTVLGAAGAALIAAGTAVSRVTWAAVGAMAVVGFTVLFSAAVSSVLASATTSLLLSFILPVSIRAPWSAVPDRLAGWGLAWAASMLAVALLWPAPVLDPLGGSAAAASRALAARLRSDVAAVRGGPHPAASTGRPAVERRRAEAVGALHRAFLTSPYRAAGLTTGSRALVRVADELEWLDAMVVHGAPRPGVAVDRGACAVRVAVAEVLERCADLLDAPRGDRAALRAAVRDLRDRLEAMEDATAGGLPPAGSGRPPGEPGGGGPLRAAAYVSALDPSFRSQEMGFAVTQIARNVDLAAAAERRRWTERLLGRVPRGVASPVAAAQRRAAAHAGRHSVWLHNSVRGAIGLALAVATADLTSVQHSFWVVLGTLSVLRSNALNTGQSVLRALLGTVAGSVVGGLLLAAIGTGTPVLWLLLPPAILVAGVAPTVVSFAAGQAGFTLTLVILYNIVQPAGWRLGLLRLEDIAIGCAVSLLVGLFFWPRGAHRALGRALSDAYEGGAAYLVGAVGLALSRCGASPAGGGASGRPAREAERAAAAAGRLDAAFRTYLAERGAKPVPLAEMTTLVTGVAALRLAGDAVLDLWRRSESRAQGERACARRELLAGTEHVSRWYGALAAALEGNREVPEPLPRDPGAVGRLVESVGRDLREARDGAADTAVRIIWTGDHVDATRRLQAALASAARSASETGPVARRRGGGGGLPGRASRG